MECDFQVGICLGLYTQNETEIECENGNKNSCVFSHNTVVLAPFQSNAMFSRNRPIQECIPVGCVPPALYRKGVLCPEGCLSSGSLSRGFSVQRSLSGGSMSGDSLSEGSLSRSLSLSGGSMSGDSLSRDLCQWDPWTETSLWTE